MEFHNINEINTIVSEIPYVEIIEEFKKVDFYLEGKVAVLKIDGLSTSIEFVINIFPQYPLKHHQSESIKFINKDLIEYNHVMGDGSICIHTLHSPVLKKKINSDFDSLKEWIIKYYLNKDEDIHYEHIIVDEKVFDNDLYYSYQFTDLDYKFNKGDFGEVDLALLKKGVYKEKNINNYIVQSFQSKDGVKIECQWNSAYKNLNQNSMGVFLFIEDTPALNKRFAFSNWLDFEKYFPDKFLEFLYSFNITHIKKYPKAIVPIFIGYRTVKDEIHWLVSMCSMDNFPIMGVKEKNIWKSQLIDKKINWGISRNSSYKYLFGRGTFCEQITNSRILIIGVGAIGSIVAKTLVKSGARSIDLVDYDVKEPENVCRSEYQFSTGLTNKVDELTDSLFSNSPFVEVNIGKKEYFESIIKTFHREEESKKDFEKVLSEYDVIFNCSADSDLMYILSKLNFNCDLINLSITNHAKDLVCAFHPNIYRFVNNQFIDVLQNDIDDLYNPTGCWSPTFRGSYNDINLLVQFALKHINKKYKGNLKKNNFTLSVEEIDNLTINLKEY